MDINVFHHRLIVSCQALEGEPLHSSFIMGRMAVAAERGGAVGIRANSVVDINEIKRNVALPTIGIIKQDYPGSEVYITATMKEASALVEQTKTEIVALDATARPRPTGVTVAEILNYIHRSGRLAMADISNYDEGIRADALGFDLISTTMSGYTDYTLKRDRPDFELVSQLSQAVKTPIIMEGHTTTPEDVVEGFERGAFAAIVGGAITRPQQITARYVGRIDQYNHQSD